MEQEYKSRIATLGSGEVWIKGKSNTVYIAPTMVLHYIMEHGYTIPAEVKHASMEMQ